MKSYTNSDITALLAKFKGHLTCWKVGLSIGSLLYFEMGNKWPARLENGSVVEIGSTTLVLESDDWIIAWRGNRIADSDSITQDLVDRLIWKYFIGKSLKSIEYMNESKECLIYYGGDDATTDDIIIRLRGGVDENMCTITFPDGTIIVCNAEGGFLSDGSRSDVHVAAYSSEDGSLDDKGSRNTEPGATAIAQAGQIGVAHHVGLLDTSARAQAGQIGVVHAAAVLSGVGAVAAAGEIVTRVVSLLLQTVIVPGARTDEGKLIEAVALPWFDIIALLQQDPSIAYQISWEKWEEIIAGAYKKAGFDEVTLTPRSGDYGRDVIAIKKGIGSVRVIDQVKAYKPPHLVTANDVRALVGVLTLDGAAKGFLTTTSDFAPKIRSDRLLKKVIPSRIQLINGTDLFKRLQELAQKT